MFSSYYAGYRADPQEVQKSAQQKTASQVWHFNDGTYVSNHNPSLDLMGKLNEGFQRDFDKLFQSRKKKNKKI